MAPAEVNGLLRVASHEHGGALVLLAACRRAVPPDNCGIWLARGAPASCARRSPEIDPIRATAPATHGGHSGEQNNRYRAQQTIKSDRRPAVHNGGSGRAYEILCRSHSVRPDPPTCRFRSPIIRSRLAIAGRWWRRADYLFGGGGPPVGAVRRCGIIALSAAKSSP